MKFRMSRATGLSTQLNMTSQSKRLVRRLLSNGDRQSVYLDFVGGGVSPQRFLRQMDFQFTDVPNASVKQPVQVMAFYSGAVYERDMPHSDTSCSLRRDTARAAQPDDAHVYTRYGSLCFDSPSVVGSSQLFSSRFRRSERIVALEFARLRSDDTRLFAPAPRHPLAVALPESRAPVAVASHDQPQKRQACRARRIRQNVAFRLGVGFAHPLPSLA